MRLSIMIAALTYLFCLNAYAEHKVAVIDSGYNVIKDPTIGTKLCDTGHYDYIAGKEGIGNDNVGHGSVVSALVGKGAMRKNYCVVSLKVIDKRSQNGGVSDNICMAIKRSIELKVTAINISLSGNDYNFCEYRAIKQATRKGIKVFVAAGNDHKDLNEACDIYPACYIVRRNYYVVGALDVRYQPAWYSNKGIQVNIWKQGDAFGPYNTGTSFASPRAAGQYIYSLKKYKRKRKNQKDNGSGQSFRKAYN